MEFYKLKGDKTVDIKESSAQAPPLVQVLEHQDLHWPCLKETAGVEHTPGQPDRDPTGEGGEQAGACQNMGTWKQQNRYVSRVFLKTGVGVWWVRSNEWMVQH